MCTEVEDIIKDIQPHYTRLNSRYSKAYLKGSFWYVGDDLTKWWERSNTLRYYRYYVKKLLVIVELIMSDLNTQIKKLSN